jgi:very-short-patch-repair endonuclease
MQLGYSRRQVEGRLASGRWRRVLPHTYLTVDTFTWRDRLDAALAFTGPHAVLSGAAGLIECGVQVPRPVRILVLAPRSSAVRNWGWVQVCHTTRMPEPIRWYGPRRAPVERAVADYARSRRRIDDVRAVVASAVRSGGCTVDELTRELAESPRNGSALLRQALAEVSAGAASAPEARAAALIRRANLPPFEQNARIDLPGGGYFVVDFLWRALRAILEIDSVEHHLDPVDWAATQDRHLKLSTLGYSVVHRPPSALRDEVRFAAEVRAWLFSCAR